MGRLMSYKKLVQARYMQAECILTEAMPAVGRIFPAFYSLGVWAVIDQRGAVVNVLGSADSAKQAWHNAWLSIAAHDLVKAK